MAPANFRTYEGQNRLLTAIIAAHPDLKLNYKAIAAHYGSDWSHSGIEHFFRPVKSNAKAIQAMVRRNEDPATYDHKLIHKYFGQSTPDGIQFQFRQIKRDAEDMRQGKETTTLPSSSASTPAKAPRTPKTPVSRGSKRAAPSTTGRSSATATATPANKKAKTEVSGVKRQVFDVDQQVSDEETMNDLNAEDLEVTVNAGDIVNQTPTKPRGGQQHGHEPLPDLETTQVASPEDDDATLTPHEDTHYSFAQATNSQYSALAANPWATSGFSDQQYPSSFAKEEFDDDGEV